MLINHIENPNEEAWKGYFYAILLFGAGFFTTLFGELNLLETANIGIQIRSALVSAIFRKSLNLF